MPLFRHLTAFLLLAAFLVQSFSRTAVVVDYYSNTNTFARNCVNKARPLLHCNGKCQLMKKLKAIEDKEQSANQAYKSQLASDLMYSRSFFDIPEQACFMISCEHTQRQSDATPVDRSYDLFHPPTQS
jgi:hypothetical protein